MRYMHQPTHISIHAPTRGATEVRRVNGQGRLFQSTLPQGERRTNFIKRVEEIYISIHAPTRGATKQD